MNGARTLKLELQLSGARSEPSNAYERQLTEQVHVRHQAETA